MKTSENFLMSLGSTKGKHRLIMGQQGIIYNSCEIVIMI